MSDASACVDFTAFEKRSYPPAHVEKTCALSTFSALCFAPHFRYAPFCGMAILGDQKQVSPPKEKRFFENPWQKGLTAQTEIGILARKKTGQKERNWEFPLFAIFTRLRSFEPFCALLRSFADLHLRSFAFFLGAHLRVSVSD